jgi:hypothetical protein
MLPRYWTLWPECQGSSLKETWHHLYGEALCWQHHAVGMFFSGRDWETSQDQGIDEQRKVQRSLMKTCSRALRTSDWDVGSPSNRTTTLSTQPRQCRSGCRSFSECPWVAQPELRFEPEQTSLKMFSVFEYLFLLCHCGVLCVDWFFFSP